MASVVDEIVSQTRSNVTIRRSGNIPKSILGFAWFQLTFNVYEEQYLIQKTLNDSELNQSYKDILNNLSVIGGLIIAFCFSATQNRQDSTSVAITTIWGHRITNFETIFDIYGLFIALALVTSFFLVIYSTTLSICLSQIPPQLTSRLFALIGAAGIAVVFVSLVFTLAFFIIATMIQISLNYSSWVTITMIVTLVVFVLLFSLNAMKMNAYRMELLREEYEKIQESQVIKIQESQVIKKNESHDDNISRL